MGKVLRKEFSKEEIQKSSKHRFNIRKMQSDTTIRYHRTLVRLAKIVMTVKPITVISHTAGGKEDWSNHFKHQFSTI